jgi:hypothetical protein
MSEKTVKFIEGGLQCENVMINVGVDPATCVLTVTNTRYLNIEKVLVRRLEPVDSAYCDEGSGTQLKVKQSMSCPQTNGWSGKIEVVPIVEVNNDLVACKNKAISLDC